MNWVAEFHLLRPWWLLALLPWALWCLRLWRGGQARAGAWTRAVDPELLEALLQSGARPSPWPQRIAALGLLIAIIALAGPAWERLPQPVFATDQARVLVIDLSRSMDAADLAPSRLGRARFAAADLLRSFQEGRFGVVAFAGTAFDVLPLTDDAATAKHLIDSLTTDLMPVQGGDIASGLQRAGALLDSTEVSHGEVILLTDSQAGSAALGAAQKLREQGHRLWVIGFGSAQGAPIPRPGGGWMTDAQGGIALAALDAAGLAQLARAGGGRYLDYPAAGLRAENLPWEAAAAAAERQATELQTDTWLDRGQWLVWLLLPLAALAFRRGAWAALALLLFVLPLPPASAEPKAEAAETSGWWQNADQRAWWQLQQGRAEQAAQLFEDPRWQAAAQYRVGKFSEAAELLAAPETAADHYNRGNALARAGRLQEALAAYEAALELQPADEDAQFNRKLVEQLLQQQEQSQQQQKGDEGEQESQDQQSGQNGEQGQDGQQDQNQQAQQDQQQAGQQDAQQQDGASQTEQEQSEQGEQQSAEQQQAEQGEEEQRPEDEQQDSAETQLTPAEAAEQQAQQQAVEQWLRRVPDDPGGLLRRKFQRQQQRREETTEVEQAW